MSRLVRSSLIISLFLISAFISLGQCPNATINYSGTPYCTTAAQTFATPTVGGTVTQTLAQNVYTYIPNYSSNNVSVVNTTSNSLFTTIGVGGSPYCVAVLPDGSKTYIGNQTGTVSVINTATTAVTATIPVTGSPNGITSSQDGSKVYVCNQNPSVAVINTANNSVTQLTGFASYTLSSVLVPNSNLAYVTLGNNTVNLVNTATNAITATVTVGSFPISSVITPDGSKVYVANYSNGSVSVLSTATNTVLTTIVTGGNPRAITVSPDGSKVYVSNQGANVYVINTATNATTATITGFSQSQGLSVSADGTKLYVADPIANKLYTVNTATNIIVPGSGVTVGSAPYSIGNFLASVTGNSVSGTYSSNPSLGSSLNVANGFIDLSTAAGGTYTISYSLPASGGCGAYTTTTSVTITARPNATISYSGSPYCSNSVPGNVTFGGTVTGTGTFTSTAGLSLNPNTGTITPASSAVGTYTVTYTTNPSGGCSAYSTSTSVRIGAQPNATISYAGSPFCSNSSPGNVTFGGTGTGTGTFTSTAELSIDQNTGTITPASSTAGTYTVTYTTNPSSGCSAYSTSTSVRITPQPNATITYGGTPYCTTAAQTFAMPTVGGTVTQTQNGYAYIPNILSDNVSVVNTTNNTLLTTISVGSQPYGVTVIPDGTKAYIGNNNSGTVSVINTATNAVTATITVNGSPWGLTSSQDGSKVYVCNPSGTISLINTANNSVTQLTGFASGTLSSALVPNSNLAYVTLSNNTVNLVNTATNAITATITVGSNPVSNVITPDGTKVYVANYFSGSVSVISTVTNTVITTIGAVGTPRAITVSPDGSKLYVSNQGAKVYVINTATNVTSATITGFSQSAGLSVSADGTKLYVVDQGTNKLYTVNTATNTIIPGSTVAVGSAPFSVGNFLTPAFVSGIYSSNPSLGSSLNSANGFIDLSTAAGGTYTISYSLPASGGCGAYTTTTSVTITRQPNATISYTGSPYCSSSSPGNVTFGGTATGIGTFTSTAGLAIDQNTGTVTPASSTAGSYTVTYITNPSGGCSAYSTSTSVRITAQPNATISYAGSPFCSNSSPGNVTFGGTATGTGTFTSTAGLSLNPNTGTITPASSTAGTYTVTYTTNPSGVCSAYSTSTSVRIAAQPNATISYVGSPFCSNSSTGNVTFGGTATGTGTFTSTAGLSIDQNTGTVTPASSTAGTYTVTYTTNPSGGCSAYSTSTSVRITPQPNATINYSGTPYCTTAAQSFAMPTVGGTVTQTQTQNVYAYIANFGSNNVSVVNTTSNSLLTTFGVGGEPYCVTVLPDGSKAYIGNSSSGTVSVINTATNAVTATIPVIGSPNGITSSQDGSKVYVCNNTPNVAVINTANNSVTQLTGFASYTLSSVLVPNSNMAYVTLGNNTVNLVNTATNAITATVTVGSFPTSSVITPDGSKVYVANIADGSVSVINTTTNTVLTTIVTGGTPRAITVSPDGSKVYVPNEGAKVYVINTATNATSATITGFSLSEGLSVSADGTKLYVVDQGTNKLYTVNTATNIIVPGSTVAVGSGPISLGNFLASVAGNPVSGTYSSNPSLGSSLNAANGFIDLSTAAGGTYIISYSLPASAGCGVYTTTTSVTITGRPNATISYSGSPFCSSTAPGNVTFGGTATGTGTFTSTAGLSIDQNTGTITQASSTAGTYTVTYTTNPSGGCSAYSTSTSIRITAQPNATISYAGSPYCSNSSPGNVTFGGTATGTGTFTSTAGLSLNPNTGTVTPASSTAGTYTVTYTTNAAGGCSSYSTSTMVTITQQPNATISYAGSPYCSNSSPGNVTFGGTVTGTGTFTATAGLSINQNTGTVTPASSTAGTYTVTYTTNPAGGCSAYSTNTTVVVNPTPSTPTITPGGPTTFCAGGSVTLTSSSASGNQWYVNNAAIGGATSQNYSAAASGNYTVIITSLNCSSAPSTGVTVTVNPVPATPTITPGGPTTFCAGGSVTLSSNASSGNQWYLNGGPISGAISQTYTANSSGNFTVVVTSLNCSSNPSGPITVTANPIPNAVATPSSQTVCSGVPITTIALSGTVTGTVYNWSRDNTGTVTGMNSSGAGNISGTLTNSTTTPVTVTFTIIPAYTNGGVTCTGATITATVTVNPGPAITCPSNINVPSDQGQCGAVVNFAATASGAPTPAITYSKNPGTLFPVGTTTVTAAATNSCGTATCTFTVTVAGPIVSIPPSYAVAPPGGAANTIYKTYGAQSLSLTANVSGAVNPTYSWSGTAITGATNTQTVTVAPTVVGDYIYTVSVTANGCQANGSTIVHVVSVSSGGNGNKVTLCQTSTNTTITIGPGWVPSYLANGYTLGACTGVGAIMLADSSADLLTPDMGGTNNSKFSVAVSPNPSSGEFKLKVTSSSSDEIHVRILDNIGRVLQVIDKVTVGSIVTFGNNLVSGTYFAEVIQGENKKVVKLVRMN